MDASMRACAATPHLKVNWATVRNGALRDRDRVTWTLTDYQGAGL